MRQRRSFRRQDRPDQLQHNFHHRKIRHTVLCHEWSQKPLADKTWTNLQLYFKAADKDMHATVTTGTSGYTANATLLSDLTQALNNLSNNSNSRLTAVA
jgi:hypothetical protein